MDGEIHTFIKVWITAILCLCYCYSIASRIPEGILRLLSLIPVFYLFFLLPFNLHSFHLGAPTTFFLVWICSFKLLLFSFDQPPLSPPPPNVLHFICIASLPIKIKPTPNSEKPKPHHEPRSKIAKLIPLGLKLLLLGVIVRAYDYRETLHPHLILILYCFHLYLGLELVLALCAAPARAIFGFEMEPQFKDPYLCTSLQDFWGRRWNLMVTSILRPTVHNPVRRMSTLILGPALGRQPAVMATFAVSGLMHELIYYYLSRVPPTWEVTWFFVLQGACTTVEGAAKKVLERRGWRLHGAVSGPLTVLFLVITGKWLFFPQLMRNGVDRRAIGEYAIMTDFVKSKFPYTFVYHK